MGAPLLLFTAGVYVMVAWEYAAKGQPGMALAFASYAAANVGFAWDVWR
jgi:hypothetical protein